MDNVAIQKISFVSPENGYIPFVKNNETKILEEGQLRTLDSMQTKTWPQASRV